MIGDKIKKLRQDNKMTQDQLAKKLGVQQTHLNRWEKGHRIPALQTLIKISQTFDISLDALVFNQKDIKSISNKNKTLLSKLKEIEKLTDSDKEMVFNLINSLAEKQKPLSER